jgi:hypothetical protein
MRLSQVSAVSVNSALFVTELTRASLAGRTSSVGMELLGFTPAGTEVLPDGASHPLAEKSNAAEIPPQGSVPRKQQLSWEDISAKASKIISFSDLAGHEVCPNTSPDLARGFDSSGSCRDISKPRSSA